MCVRGWRGVVVAVEPMWSCRNILPNHLQCGRMPVAQQVAASTLYTVHIKAMAYKLSFRCVSPHSITASVTLLRTPLVASVVPCSPAARELHSHTYYLFVLWLPLPVTTNETTSTRRSEPRKKATNYPPQPPQNHPKRC
ncbi:hypothetical protein TRVL_03429 [Trypanosoma vivax]|nr:hypothetical protein TRVL_03429 [Trypanosoma vivax]